MENNFTDRLLTLMKLSNALQALMVTGEKIIMGKATDDDYACFGVSQSAAFTAVKKFGGEKLDNACSQEAVDKEIKNAQEKFKLAISEVAGEC